MLTSCNVENAEFNLLYIGQLKGGTDKYKLVLKQNSRSQDCLMVSE